MANPMNDEQITARIEELEAEERRLRADESAEGTPSDSLAEDAQRLKEIKVELDRLWDYLRQRRALRDAGGDPDDASLRDADTVEHYKG